VHSGYCLGRFTIQLLVLPWSWRVFAAEMYYFDFWGMVR